MSNADRVRELIDRGFRQGDLSIADELVADSYVEHQYPAPTGLSGADIMKADIRHAREQLAGFSYDIEDVAEAGEKVWSRIECRGVDGRSGRAVTMSVIDIWRFEDGKLIEHWGVPDRFAFMHQTGLIPV